MLKRDISGSDGNAFSIMGLSKDLAKQLGYDTHKIITEMQSSDFNNLLEVFTLYFGTVVELVSPHEIESLASHLYTIEPNPYC